MTEAAGRYYDTLPGGQILLAVTLPEGADAEEARVLFYDREGITADQRRKVFAICAEISIWSTGTRDDADQIRRLMQEDFLRKNMERLQLTIISLASGGNCDKGMASMLIDYLINFCLENDVPTREPLASYADSLEAYTYAALLHKRCIVCGKKADLHHVDRIGAGYNRATKPQIGARVMPLCRIHHGEVDTLGQTAFDEKYHTVAVKMDKRIAAKYGISGRAAT